MISNPRIRANTKYKRIRTLVKNCLEISRLCDVKMNLLVFNSANQKLQENFTDPEVALDKLIAQMT